MFPSRMLFSIFNDETYLVFSVRVGEGAQGISVDLKTPTRFLSLGFPLSCKSQLTHGLVSHDEVLNCQLQVDLTEKMAALSELH